MEEQNKHQILIVDDSAMARTIIKRSVEICGVENAVFYEAGDGKEAMEVVKNQKIDLVFTDINMPNMNGEQLLIRLKSSPKWFEIPVVVITSLNNPANEKKLITEHATAVISKPVTIPAIHEVLSEILKIL